LELVYISAANTVKLSTLKDKHNVGHYHQVQKTDAQSMCSIDI